MGIECLRVAGEGPHDDDRNARDARTGALREKLDIDHFGADYKFVSL
jgi:hypothetical protein